jgi:hypothetical protein
MVRHLGERVSRRRCPGPPGCPGSPLPASGVGGRDRSNLLSRAGVYTEGSHPYTGARGIIGRCGPRWWSLPDRCADDRAAGCGWWFSGGGLSAVGPAGLHRPQSPADPHACALPEITAASTRRESSARSARTPSARTASSLDAARFGVGSHRPARAALAARLAGSHARLPPTRPGPSGERSRDHRSVRSSLMVIAGSVL